MCNREPDEIIFSERCSQQLALQVAQQAALEEVSVQKRVIGAQRSRTQGLSKGWTWAFISARSPLPTKKHLSFVCLHCSPPGALCPLLLVEPRPQEQFMALLLIKQGWLLLSSGGNPDSLMENVRFPKAPRRIQVP